MAQQSSLEDAVKFLLEAAKVPFCSLLTHPPSSPYPGRKVLVWILPAAPEICSIFQGDAFVVIASLDSTHKITIEVGHFNSKLLSLMVRMPDTYKHVIVAQALIQSEDKVSIQLFSQFVKKNLGINPMVINMDNSAGEKTTPSPDPTSDHVPRQQVALLGLHFWGPGFTYRHVVWP